MDKKTYVESTDGLTHLISAINGEFTLCGDAFEGACDPDEQSGEDFSWVESENGPVDCPRCKQEILNCRGVRVSP